MIGVRIAFVMLVAGLLHGQTFDAASVKPAEMPNGRGGFMMTGPSGGPGSKDPGRIHYPFMSLRNLLITAYDVKAFQIQGPAFLDTERFDITATMPPGTTKEQFRAMLQNLMAERFKMVVHKETKELPVYTLTVAKGGPKMKESPSAHPPTGDDDTPPPPPERPPIGADGFPIIPLPSRGGIFNIMMPGRGRMIAAKQTMQDFATRLTQQLNRPVTDATGLTAKYDFTLTFSWDGMERPPGMPGPVGMGVQVAPPSGLPASTDAEAAPDIFSAVQSQLGLKLDAKKGMVELVVIDHIEKTATDN